MLKHATAGVFHFTRSPNEQWLLVLIQHSCRSWRMLPGGYVQDDENPAEAALRETAEETGLTVRLIRVAHVPVPLPLWIVEQQVPADSRHDGPHVHVDHLNLAVADSATPAVPTELPFTWHRPGELSQLEMFTDTRAFALAPFEQIDQLTVDSQTSTPSTRLA